MGPMVPSALPVAATVPPSSGIWAQRRPSHSTLWTLVTRSMPSHSRQTAAGAVIKIWDLEQKIIVEELKPEVMGHKEGSPPVCTSLCWSSDGQTLFAGYTDNLIRVWSLSVPRSLA